MQINTYKPEYTEDFKVMVSNAEHKKLSHLVDMIDGRIFITAYCGSRPVCRATFIIDEQKCILEKRIIIDRSYNPFEYIIFVLAKYLKRKKIKYLLWI